MRMKKVYKNFSMLNLVRMIRNLQIRDFSHNFFFRREISVHSACIARAFKVYLGYQHKQSGGEEYAPKAFIFVIGANLDGKVRRDTNFFPTRLTFK